MKKFIDNNIDITESTFAPMHDYFDLYKNVIIIIIDHVIIIIIKKINIFFLEFCEKIIKLYFNIEYTKNFLFITKRN